MFERIYTITDFYDGPRGGIADCGGIPHVYQSQWSDARDEDEDTFLLSPVDQTTLALALEDWAIWRRWEHAFHQGLATLDSHPSLPEDRDRYRELQSMLAESLLVDPSSSLCRQAEFRATSSAQETGVIAVALEVRWHELA